MLKQEIDYAVHLGIERVVVDLPDLEDSPNIDNFARVLSTYLEDIQTCQRIIIRI